MRWMQCNAMQCILLFTSVNMSSSWVITAICFQSNSCISFTIPGAMVLSGGTGRRKVGKLSTSDNRGDVEAVDICIKAYQGNDTMINVLKCTCVSGSPVPGSRMVPGQPLAELPLSSLPQWWESQSHSCWWYDLWSQTLLAYHRTVYRKGNNGILKLVSWFTMTKMTSWSEGVCLLSHSPIDVHKVKSVLCQCMEGITFILRLSLGCYIQTAVWEVEAWWLAQATSFSTDS